MLLTGVVFASLLMLGQAPEVPADDLSTIFSNLKAAEQKKDTEAVLKLAGEVSKSAKAIIAQPAPTDADELATHKSRVDFAKEVDTYADYAVYVSALRAPDAAKRIEIFDILEKQSPKSEYVPQLYSIYVGALAQTGQSAKMYPFAEKAIQRDKTNEDLLVILADGAMARKQWDRAADFGTRLAAVMSGHAKPDGMLMIPVARHAEFVQMMPLRGIPGIGPSLEKRLNAWGVDSVADLAKMSMESLEQATGSAISARGLYIT